MDPQQGLAAFAPGGASVPATPQPGGGVRRVSDNVSMTDFSDDSVKQYEFTLYSGKTGETHRIQILRPDSIAKGRSHFHDKLKGGILCRSQYVLTPDGKQENLAQEAQCCKVLGTPGLRFAALVIQYGTTRDGQVARPFSYEQKLWRFGVDKYIQLRNINRDFPLVKTDLSVYCTDDNYQKLQIQPKGDCLLAQMEDPNQQPEVRQVAAQIRAWADASVNKLPRELGRTFASDQDLMAFLQQNGVLQGVSGPAPAMVPQDQPVANFGDIIGQLAGPTT